MADDPLMQRLTAILERQSEQLDRLTTLQAIANERLAHQEEQWRLVLQRLDRQDATLAGISLTLVRLGSSLDAQTAALKQQTQVLDRLQTTLDRWLAGQGNGRPA
jgi:hypothetical protein